MSKNLCFRIAKIYYRIGFLSARNNLDQIQERFYSFFPNKQNFFNTVHHKIDKKLK